MHPDNDTSEKVALYSLRAVIRDQDELVTEDYLYNAFPHAQLNNGTTPWMLYRSGQQVIVNPIAVFVPNNDDPMPMIMARLNQLHPNCMVLKSKVLIPKNI
jgi:hypothetical protein